MRCLGKGVRTRRLVVGLVCAISLGAALPATAAGIQYNFRNFVLMDPPPRVSELATYQQRQFNGAVAESRAVTATNGVQGYACTLAFQDAARTTGDDAAVVPIVGYSGCPFTVPVVASESWLALREKLTINIMDVRDGAMYVSPESLVPFVADPGRTPFPAPTAVGVTWRFAKAGIRFNTQAGEFVTGSAGATATFTANGVRFQGFRKAARGSNRLYASNGWARDTMRTVQERLTRLGYKPGPIDGLWGNRTRDALLAFQRSAGIDGSGTLDARTLLELGI
ncbi:MAG: peptidoglycan-binding domain-containing protein [Pseudomonadota bacterium]